MSEKTYEVIGMFTVSEAKNIERFISSMGVRSSFLAEKAVLKFLLSPHKTGIQDCVFRKPSYDSENQKKVRKKFTLTEETFLMVQEFCWPDPTAKKRHSISKVIAQAILQYIDSYNLQNGH